MRDIGRRIQRYRLSRYAPPGRRAPRRLGWIGLAALAWIAWAGLISENSWWRIWRLGQETATAERALASARSERTRLESELDDPRARIERLEGELRENGLARPDEIVYRIRPVPPDSLRRPD